MKTRDMVIGLVVLVILIAAVLIIRNARNRQSSLVPTSTPSITQKINSQFPNFNIPDNVEKAELKDVSGGESFGVATRSEIIANLPDIGAGQSYQAWLANSAGKKVLLGSLRFSKGGWILDYSGSKYPNYNTVSVSLGSQTILQGSF